MKRESLTRSQRPCLGAGARSGYTLSELLVVIAIIGILVSLSVFVIGAANRSVSRMTGEIDAAVAALKKSGTVHRTLPLGAVKDQYIVVFKDGVANPQAEVDRIKEKVALKLLHLYNAGGSFSGFSAEIPAADLAMVKKDPAVKYIDPNFKVAKAAQPLTTGVRRINANPIITGLKHKSLGGRPLGAKGPRNIIKGGKVVTPSPDVTVAILDTGIDSAHPDLNVTLSVGFGYPDGEDVDGHGTHVGGIAGAKHNDFGVVGACPGCRLWSVKVLGPTGSGTTADVLAGVQFVRANAGKIQVANMSLGIAAVVPSVNDAVDDCVRAGVVMVVAAGNSSADAAGFSPASASRAICVAAMADSDGLPGAKGPKTSAGDDDTFADFSNFGQTVELIAPGVDILSSFVGRKYKVESGTSMAAPYVAGLAARLLSGPGVNPSIRNMNLPPELRNKSRLTPDDVLFLLQWTSTETIPGRFDKLKYTMVNAEKF